MDTCEISGCRHLSFVAEVEIFAYVVEAQKLPNRSFWMIVETSWRFSIIKITFYDKGGKPCFKLVAKAAM